MHQIAYFFKIFHRCQILRLMNIRHLPSPQCLPGHLELLFICLKIYYMEILGNIKVTQLVTILNTHYRLFFTPGGICPRILHNKLAAFSQYMNIDIFKLFLPLNLTNRHFKMYQIASFFIFSRTPLTHGLHRS